MLTACSHRIRVAQEMRTHLEDRQSGVELDAKQWQLGCTAKPGFRAAVQRPSRRY